MKKPLLIAAACLVAGKVLAQEPDTLQRKTLHPADTLPRQEEQVDPAGESPAGSPAGSNAPEKEKDPQPRIFYYKASPDHYQTTYTHKRARRNDIKTLAGTMNHSGGFGALSFRWSEFREELVVLAGIRGGWIINRTLGIGFEGHGIIPTAKFEDVDSARRVVLLGGYGGMFLELIFFSNQVIHVTFPVSGGAGWIGYNEDWEQDLTIPAADRGSYLVDEDVFWYLEPGVDLEVNVSRNFRMCFGVSKRFTQDLELIRSGKRPFDTLNYFVTLKVGGF